MDFRVTKSAGTDDIKSQRGEKHREVIQYSLFFVSLGDSMVAYLVQNLPARREIQVQSLGWEHPLEEGMATHSSILAWRIPWSLADYNPCGCKELDTTEPLTLFMFTFVSLSYLTISEGCR